MAPVWLRQANCGRIRHDCTRHVFAHTDIDSALPALSRFLWCGLISAGQIHANWVVLLLPSCQLIAGRILAGRAPYAWGHANSRCRVTSCVACLDTSVWKRVLQTVLGACVLVGSREFRVLCSPEIFNTETPKASDQGDSNLPTPSVWNPECPSPFCGLTPLEFATAACARIQRQPITSRMETR